MTAAPILKGRTELVEQAARDCCAWAEPEDDLAPARRISFGLLVMLPIWSALIAWWMWS